MTRLRSVWIAWGLPLLAAASCAFGLRSLVEAYSIPSSSMDPALKVGDHILVTPYGLGRYPERGDVIVFRHPELPDDFLVKRVIGLPGDHIEIRRGKVRVNGSSLAEPYLALRETMQAEFSPDIVGASEYFVLGDFRDNSIDSRRFGAISRRSIQGKARLIYWSAGDGESSREAAALEPRRVRRRMSVRWERILTSIDAMR